jgi:hypothetical protein
MKTIVFTFALLMFAGSLSYAQSSDFNGTLPDYNDMQGSIDPITGNLVVTEPVVSSTPVATTDPATTTDPGATTPVVTDPGTTTPVVTEPPAIDPVVSNPDTGSGSSDPITDKHGHHKKPRKPNFGMIVSAEAHRLKAEGINGQHKMGGWVSDQRRQNSGDKQAAGGAACANSGSGHGSDKREAASTVADSSAKGKSGSHRR